MPIANSCLLYGTVQCPILEDNAYEGLNFEPVPPPIKALDRHDWSLTSVPSLKP